jgi:hypothetical protein
MGFGLTSLSQSQGMTAGLTARTIKTRLRSSPGRTCARGTRRVRGAHYVRASRTSRRSAERDSRPNRVKHANLERVSRPDLLVMLNRCRKCDLLPASWHSPLETCEGDGSRIEQRPPFVRRILSVDPHTRLRRSPLLKPPGALARRLLTCVSRRSPERCSHEEAA